MKIIAIYDTGEDGTVDRYTVVTNVTELNAQSKDMMHILGLSEGGTAVSQWSVGEYFFGLDNPHLGERIHFEDLSAATQKHIAQRIFSEE